MGHSRFVQELTLIMVHCTSPHPNMLTRNGMEWLLRHAARNVWALFTCIRWTYFCTVVSWEDLSLAREAPMPSCSKASAQSLWAHMFPKLNSEILRGLLPSAAAAAAPRGVEGSGMLITSTSAWQDKQRVEEAHGTTSRSDGGGHEYTAGDYIVGASLLVFASIMCFSTSSAIQQGFHGLHAAWYAAIMACIGGCVQYAVPNHDSL